MHISVVMKYVSLFAQIIDLERMHLIGKASRVLLCATPGHVRNANENDLCLYNATDNITEIGYVSVSYQEKRKGRMKRIVFTSSKAKSSAMANFDDVDDEEEEEKEQEESAVTRNKFEYLKNIYIDSPSQTCVNIIPSLLSPDDENNAFMFHCVKHINLYETNLQTTFSTVIDKSIRRTAPLFDLTLQGKCDTESLQKDILLKNAIHMNALVATCCNKFSKVAHDLVIKVVDRFFGVEDVNSMKNRFAQTQNWDESKYDVTQSLRREMLRKLSSFNYEDGEYTLDLVDSNNPVSTMRLFDNDLVFIQKYKGETKTNDLVCICALGQDGVDIATAMK